MRAANAVLTTPRLTLEPITAAHAPLLFAGLSDPSLYPFIPQNPPADVEALEARYRRLESRSSPEGDEWWLNWAVRLTDGPYVGVVQATVDEDNLATLAWFTFSDRQRQGYAFEAVTALCAHLEGPFMAEAFEVRIDTRNLASIGLVEKLGFERVQTVSGADYFKGARSDEHVYRKRPAGAAPSPAKRGKR
jgi:RimJ/RimL family protein N-acetyltransferase